MSYFKKFPHILYEFNNKRTIVQDIFRRSRFISEHKPYTDLYSTYVINDGETPQSIAYEMYGSEQLHWVVLLFNEIHDPIFDWPLTQLELTMVCEQKYGISINDTKHWVNSKGLICGEVKEFITPEEWISPQNPGVDEEDNLEYIPVTFFEFESELNEIKRNITLLRPELLSEFIKQFEASING